MGRIIDIVEVSGVAVQNKHQNSKKWWLLGRIAQ